MVLVVELGSLFMPGSLTVVHPLNGHIVFLKEDWWAICHILTHWLDVASVAYILQDRAGLSVFDICLPNLKRPFIWTRRNLLFFCCSWSSCGSRVTARKAPPELHSSASMLVSTCEFFPSQCCSSTTLDLLFLGSRLLELRVKLGNVKPRGYMEMFMHMFFFKYVYFIFCHFGHTRWYLGITHDSGGVCEAIRDSGNWT